MNTDKLMAYLYGELNEEEKKLFEKELALSAELQQELKELLDMRTVMSEWKDEVPHPLSQLRSVGKKTIRFSPYSFAAGIAASFLLLALISILAGARAHYSSDSGFSIAVGKSDYVDQQSLQASLDGLKKQMIHAQKVVVQPEHAAQATDVQPPKVTARLAERRSMTEDDMKLVMKLAREQSDKNTQTMLSLMQQNQEKQLDLTMTLFARYIDQQRKADIQTISSEFEKIRRTSDDKFYETDQALNKLFQTVQYAGR